MTGFVNASALPFAATDTPTGPPGDHWHMLTYSVAIGAGSAAVVIFLLLPWVITRAEPRARAQDQARALARTKALQESDTASSPASPAPNESDDLKTDWGFLKLFRGEFRRLTSGTTPTVLSLPPGASFDIKNSWATTLTAFITATGVAAAAFSDKFDAIVDKPYAAEFALAAGLFGATALLAPIVYQTLQEMDDEGKLFGTTAGLMAASFFTLTAALGALCAADGLVLTADRLPGNVQALWTAAIAIVMILVAVYVVRSLAMLATAKTADAVNNLTTLITVTCCGREDKASTVRITLL